MRPKNQQYALNHRHIHRDTLREGNSIKVVMRIDSIVSAHPDDSCKVTVAERAARFSVGRSRTSRIIPQNTFSFNCMAFTFTFRNFVTPITEVNSSSYSSKSAKSSLVPSLDSRSRKILKQL